MAKESEQPKKSWFRGVKAEFKKIIWPAKDTLAKQTAAVVAVSVAAGVLITIVDILAKYVIEFIV